jgi:osmotically inducible protein OsmC
LLHEVWPDGENLFSLSSGRNDTKSKGASEMPVRSAAAVWEGPLKGGKGKIKIGTRFESSYSFGSRFEDEAGTNPEELIAAAHAGCFSMALAAGLEKAGFPPEKIDTTAKVTLAIAGRGFEIAQVDLETEAKVPKIDSKAFLEQAEAARKNCPVSLALAGVKINLSARLVS